MRRRLAVVFCTLAFAAVGAAAWPLRSTLFAQGRRDAVPADLVENVSIPGYENIRYWGDEITPPFEKFVTKLYETIERSAQNKTGPDFRESPNFIAISGGGDNGAFTAGLMRGWTQRGDRPVFETVTGVSTGALCAPFVFLGSAHDKDLADIYLNNGSKQLYSGRGLYGVLGNSLESTAPLERLIRHYATDSFLDEIGAQQRLGRRLLVESTNLDAQRPVIWDLTAVAASRQANRRDLFVKILLASSAVPGIFPPVEFRVTAPDGKAYHELHADGGVSAELIFVPPEAQLAALEKKIFGKTRMRTMWIVRNGKLGPEYEATRDKLISIASRGILTMVKYQVLSDLRILAGEMKAGQSKFLYQAIPQSFNSTGASSFDRAHAQALLTCGVAVGRYGSWSTQVPEAPIVAVKHQPPLPSQASEAIEKACRT